MSKLIKVDLNIDIMDPMGKPEPSFDRLGNITGVLRMNEQIGRALCYNISKTEEDGSKETAWGVQFCDGKAVEMDEHNWKYFQDFVLVQKKTSFNNLFIQQFKDRVAEIIKNK